MHFILFMVIAAVGGAGGLIFELVLFKVLSVQLGTTHTALAMVLASYMAGLGLGTYIFGRFRFSSFADRPVLAISQGLAGLFVLAIVTVLRFMDSLIISYDVPVFVEHVVIFLVTMVPTFFIGGMIPLLYRIVWASGSGRGRSIAWIYGFNSAGGIGGVLLATFVLIPHLGLFGSTLVAALLFSSVPVILFTVRVPERRSVERGNSRGPARSGFSPVGLAVLAATAGFCGLALEIVWVRVLGTFLPNRHYSFGLMLAIYLFGYSLGSMGAGRFLSSGRRAGRFVPVIFVVLGLLSMGTVLLVQLIPDLMYLIRGVFASSWRQIILPPAIMSFLMVFPATFVMGMVLPVLVGLYPVAEGEIGRDVGRLFGINIGFSILGSLLAGFVVLPAVGAMRTTLIIGLLYTGMGLAVLLRTRQAGIAGKLLLFLSGGILFVSFIGLLKPDLLPKPMPVSVGREESRDDKLLFFKETAAGTITVVEDSRTSIRWSYINNSAVCGTTYDALKVVRILAHLPMLAHSEPRQVLVIGFGLGVTAGNVLTYPVEQVDCIELCPGLAEAAPLYESFNHGVLKDKRLSLIGGDGRRWLKRTEKKYDVITCDPTHPVLGSGNLYTTEYFKLIKTHLKHKGMFVQYYPFRYLTTAELKRAISTFHQVFPHSYLWLGYSHGVMLGCRQPLAIDPAAWQDKLTDNPNRFDLVRSSLSRVYDWLAIMLMGSEELSDFCGSSQPISDWKPILEYPRFDSVHPFTWADNMAAVSRYRHVKTAKKLLAQDQPDQNFMPMLERFYNAQSLLIQGTIERNRGNIDKAMSLYKQARKINWDDTEIRSIHQFLQQKIGEERKKKYLGQK